MHVCFERVTTSALPAAGRRDCSPGTQAARSALVHAGRQPPTPGTSRESKPSATRIAGWWRPGNTLDAAATVPHSCSAVPDAARLQPAANVPSASAAARTSGQPPRSHSCSCAAASACFPCASSAAITSFTACVPAAAARPAVAPPLLHATNAAPAARSTSEAPASASIRPPSRSLASHQRRRTFNAPGGECCSVQIPPVWCGSTLCKP